MACASSAVNAVFISSKIPKRMVWLDVLLCLEDLVARVEV
jgi:hypothetical protein